MSIASLINTNALFRWSFFRSFFKFPSLDWHIINEGRIPSLRLFFSLLLRYRRGQSETVYRRPYYTKNQKRKDKRTKVDLQITTKKTNNLVTSNPQKVKTYMFQVGNQFPLYSWHQSFNCLTKRTSCDMESLLNTIIRK